MKLNELATLFIRFLSLYIITTFLLSLAEYSFFPLLLREAVKEPHARAALFSAILRIVLYIATTAVFWMYSEKIGKALTKGLESDRAIDIPFSLKEAQMLGVFLIGVYILSFTIPDSIKLFLTYTKPELNPSANYTPTFSGKNVAQFSWAQLAYLFSKLLIGFYLVLGGSGFIGLICKLRQLGKKTPELKA